VDAAVTLYAQWTALPTYTVSYDGNGADGGTVPDPQTKIAGIALTLAGNSGSLTRAGYTFTGWNTAADGSGTDYAAGASYTVDAAVTLYAQWTTLTTYSVSYDGNGADEGSVPVDPNSYSDGAEATILDQNDLARTGYNFAGWTTNPGRTGSSESFAVGTRVAVDSRDRELYAIWVPISLSVVSDENRIAVTSYGTGFDQPGNFELPAGITEIGDNAMRNMANVTTIDIPSSVVSIGDYAFYHSSGLEEVVIHSGVKTIGSYAFGINSNLSAITIPDSVEEIGSDCFMNSESLVSIAVDAANTHYMSNGGILYDKAGTTLIAAPGGISGDIVVPSPVEKIGRTAFWECENIESIEFPPTLREIEHAAFLGTEIASVVLPEGFTTLGSTVFQNSGLASISLPSTTQTIGLQAFQNCGLLDVCRSPRECHRNWASSIQRMHRPADGNPGIRCAAGLTGRLPGLWSLAVQWRSIGKSAVDCSRRTSGFVQSGHWLECVCVAYRRSISITRRGMSRGVLRVPCRQGSPRRASL
jgi:uncharacterized repeat protein (TIGR02543 family)